MQGRRDYDRLLHQEMKRERESMEGSEGMEKRLIGKTKNEEIRRREKGEHLIDCETDQFTPFHGILLQFQNDVTICSLAKCMSYHQWSLHSLIE